MPFPLNFLFLIFFYLLLLAIGQQHKREQRQERISASVPKLPEHPHHDQNPATRRRRAYDLGTTEDVTPEEFVALERQGFFLGLTPFTNESGERHAIVVVAASEADYHAHEADR